MYGCILRHFDSLPYDQLSGADDDGSGTVTILEAYRALISAGFTPRRTVEFHFYAAEVRNFFKTTLNREQSPTSRPQEAGLLGSQAIARDYGSRGENVLAMSNVILFLSFLISSDCSCASLI